jgi:hypothetical protein
MYDGAASPCTQTFGLGMFQAPTPAGLDAIEAFYRERAAPVWHEVSPLADPSVLPLLNARGYQPCELSNVLVRSLGAGLEPAGSPTPGLAVRLVRDGEQDVWAATARAGWSDVVPEEVTRDLMGVTSRRRGALAFLAELDGKPVAAGALSIHGRVALLAGASTIPEARKRGAQLALLSARLRAAVEHGCDLAMMGAQPGSASQRNAERHGFRVAYTRTKWWRG